jgi:hypothetical protein
MEIIVNPSKYESMKEKLYRSYEADKNRALAAYEVKTVQEALVSRNLLEKINKIRDRENIDRVPLKGKEEGVKVDPESKEVIALKERLAGEVEQTHKLALGLKNKGYLGG